jgi:hypothetical protein
MLGSNDRLGATPANRADRFAVAGQDTLKYTNGSTLANGIFAANEVGTTSHSATFSPCSFSSSHGLAATAKFKKTSPRNNWLISIG